MFGSKTKSKHNNNNNNERRFEVDEWGRNFGIVVWCATGRAVSLEKVLRIYLMVMIRVKIKRIVQWVVVEEMLCAVACGKRRLRFIYLPHGGVYT